MTQGDVHEVIAALGKATKKQIMAELDRRGLHTSMHSLNDRLRGLARSQLVKRTYNGKSSFYEVIAPFPERNIITVKI